MDTLYVIFDSRNNFRFGLVSRLSRSELFVLYNFTS